jgi:hypothetical protein
MNSLIERRKIGGGNRDRTCDLLNANQMLSQLSYAPNRLTGRAKMSYQLGFRQGPVVNNVWLFKR